MSVGVANTLRQLLEAEGATFLPTMKAAALASMGGGMGLCYQPVNDGSTSAPQAYLPPSTSLAVLPYRSMITAQKARRNLALVETQIDFLGEGKKGPACVTLTANGLGDYVEEGEDTENFTQAVAAKEAELKRRLDPTNTITCYLLMLGLLYGRWPPAASTSESPVQIRFCHENKWMPTWIRHLPVQYDNLLELNETQFYQRNTSEVATQCEKTTNQGSSFSDAFLLFKRHQRKVRLEQKEMERRFVYCCEQLKCLTRPLTSVDTDEESAGNGGPSVSSGCTLQMFCWAFNSLLSRGFAYHTDVWVMIPYVDYFNYALNPNSTMKLNASSRSGNGGLVRLSEHQYEYRFTTIGLTRPGEQLLIHYGSYSDMELLMWYGFILRPFLLPSSELFVEKLKSIGKEETNGKRGRDGVEGAELVESVNASLDTKRLWQLLPCLWDDHHRRVLWGMWWSHQEGLLDEDNMRGIPFTSDEEEGSLQRNKELYVQHLKKMGETVEQLKKERVFTREYRHLLEVSYGDWSDGLQRCFSYTFSPLADTDGVYPPQSVHHTWLDDLVETFYTRHIQNTRADDTAASSAAYCDYGDTLPSSIVDRIANIDLITIAFAIAWRNGTTGLVLHEKESLVDEDCYDSCSIGVLGPSSGLRDLAERVTSRVVSLFPNNVRTAISSPSQLIRVMAWMELRNNFEFSASDGHSLMMQDIIREDYSTVTGAADSSGSASPACASMALEASKDATQLLLSIALHIEESVMEEQYMTYDA
ncbi:hypothetical protein ADEAN_000013900 [Angomonas deanei]|uniref:SET domain containing protein n=1 Tax=Angomonas deanei TaxID=59799 RepID=A0A7G2C1X7_9TRYP|nr:hypothetical protein ADEAN_000013900 [Angomonas deanei]